MNEEKDLDAMQEEEVLEDASVEEAEADQQETKGGEQAQDMPDAVPQNDSEWGEWRRKSELRAQELAAGQQAAMDAEFAKRFGEYTNPRTGQPIRTANDYLAALEAEAEIARDAEIQKAGVSPDLIRGMLEGHPVIREAQQFMERERLEKGSKMLDEQIREIGKIDPNIKTLSDIAKLPTFGEFDRMVRSGIDLVSAYKATNFEALAQRGTAAAKQAAINAVNSKGHHAKTPGSASANDGAEIPAEALPVWREMFPDDSAEKLRERYNKTLN